MPQPPDIVVAHYSADWPRIYESLRQIFIGVLGELILDVHHVGSTSVPGLAAKPVLDIDLVLEDQRALGPMISCLSKLGYEHRGDLGIPNREAFGRTSETTPVDGSGHVWMRHNLYGCTRDGLALRNHLAFRDYLRTHPDHAREYGELKRRLASEVRGDIDLYVERKTQFIVDVLGAMGLGGDDLRSITQQNRKP